MPNIANNWRNKTLEQLEKNVWDDTGIYPSYLVKRCHALRKIAVSDFTIEDLRIMIGQQFSLEHLVPLAIEKLEDNLFAEGDFYPGDLLKNVLNVNTPFWIENKDLWNRVDVLIKNRLNELDAEGISAEKFYAANK